MNIAPRDTLVVEDQLPMVPTVVEATTYKLAPTVSDEKRKKSRVAQQRCRDKKQKELDKLKEEAKQTAELKLENEKLKEKIRHLQQTQCQSRKDSTNFSNGSCTYSSMQRTESTETIACLNKQKDDLNQQLIAANQSIQQQREELNNLKRRTECQCHCQEPIENLTDEDLRELFPTDIEAADRFISALVETMDGDAQGNGDISTKDWSLRITIEQQKQIINDHKETNKLSNLKREN